MITLLLRQKYCYSKAVKGETQESRGKQSTFTEW